MVLYTLEIIHIDYLLHELIKKLNLEDTPAHRNVVEQVNAALQALLLSFEKSHSNSHQYSQAVSSWASTEKSFSS
jgi:hypothetical protein